jgi:hypothetical protein
MGGNHCQILYNTIWSFSTLRLTNKNMKYNNHKVNLFAPLPIPKATLGLLLGAITIITTITTYSQETTYENSVTTQPVGYVTLNIPPGTGTSKRNSLISIPLISTDPLIPSKATVSAIKNSNTIGFTTLNTGEAGLVTIPEGYLSNPSKPYIVHITSGEAQGFMLLVSTQTPNTTTEITLTDPHDPALDITTMGIQVGDTFTIYPCDTLLSFFGTPESTGIVGAETSSNADTVVLVNAGSANTFYFNTSKQSWVRIGLGTPNADNTPLLPYYGIQYARISTEPLSLVVLGNVPNFNRKMKIKATGTTLIGSFYPTDSTLSLTGIQNNPWWVKSTTQSQADTLVLTSLGSAATYFHNGSNWRRVSFGNPISDLISMPVGTAALLNKKGLQQGYFVYSQNQPYNL